MNVSGRIRVVIVDDDAVLVDALCQLWERDERIRIVGVAHLGKAGIELASRERPDIVVMNVHLPDMTGADATTAIVAALPGVPAIVTPLVDAIHERHQRLTERDLNCEVLSASELDVLALTEARLSLEEIAVLLGISLPTVKRQAANVYRKLSVAGGRQVFRQAPSQGPALHGWRRTGGASGGGAAANSSIGDPVQPRMHGDGQGSVRSPLEPLEQRVLELIADGLCNRETADELGVPVEGVRDALGAIFAKLGTRSKLESLIVAFRRGLIRRPAR